MRLLKSMRLLTRLYGITLTKYIHTIICPPYKLAIYYKNKILTTPAHIAMYL